MVPNGPAGRARDHMINQMLFQYLNDILKIDALQEPEDLRFFSDLVDHLKMCQLCCFSFG